MAQKLEVILEDDLDGGEAHETVSFGLDGVVYEIDLSEHNAAALRNDLAAWVGHARRTVGRSAGRRSAASRGSTTASGARSDAADVRAWARENGHEVNERGRVPSAVRQAYDDAHA